MAEYYRNLEDDEWVPVAEQGNKIACCDCGLVHEFNFKSKWYKRVYLNARRLDDETEEHRADMHGERMIRVSEDFIRELSSYSEKPMYVRLVEQANGLTLDLREEKP